MPLTLSNVSHYAKSCAEILAELYSKRSGMKLSPISSLPSFPEFPNDVLGELREVIEYGPVEIGECIATLLAHIQVQRARLEDLARWNSCTSSLLVTAFNVEDYIIDAAETYERGNALYDYARFRAGKPREINANRIVAVIEFEFKFHSTVGSTLYGRAAQWTPNFNVQFPSVGD